MSSSARTPPPAPRRRPLPLPPEAFTRVLFPNSIAAVTPPMPAPLRPYRAEPAWVPWLFLAPFLLTFGVFLVWPLIQSCLLAFQQTFGPRSTAWVGLDNFIFMFGDPLFWKAVR